MEVFGSKSSKYSMTCGLREPLWTDALEWKSDRISRLLLALLLLDMKLLCASHKMISLSS